MPYQGLAPAADGDPSWQVHGGIAVDLDDLYALAAACADAARATDAITAELGRAVLRGEAALAVLSGGAAVLAGSRALTGGGVARTAGGAAVVAATLAGAPRRLPRVTTGLRVTLAADDYAGAESGAAARARAAGATLGYLEGLAGLKAGEASTGYRVDPDALPEILAGPLAATYPNPHRTAILGPPTPLGSTAPPTGVADLVDFVAGRTGDPTPPPAGRVDVIAVHTTDPGGVPRTAYVVALPGTSDWSPPNAPPTDEVRSLQANLQLISGNPTAELAALPAALTAAGVPAGATVALVGHSQGGMTAYAAAANPAIAGRYRVAAVVTAGSPIGTMAAPRGVPVLALENADDIVPRLDGRPNPDAEHRVTVRFAGDRNASAHDLSQYVAAARRVDRTGDGPLTGIVDGLRRDGVLAEPGASIEATRTRVELRLASP